MIEKLCGEANVDAKDVIIAYLTKQVQELESQLYDASIQIQELTEQDMWCPSNCEKLEKLQQENKQLKNNWNELKEWASNFYNSEEVGWAGCGMRYTLEKIQELEQGSDSNE